MKKSPGSWLKVSFLIGAFILASTACRQSPSESADLILANGAVYTMDEGRTQVEAVAVKSGKILYAGTAKKAMKLKSPETEVIDLAGRMVLPAFQDSHIHLVSGGIELGQCNLNGLNTLDEILHKIKDYAASNPDKPWITGGGWSLFIFPEANPSKAILDQIVPDKPVYLSAADGHSAWVNSKAIEIAGISKDTPDPMDGRIERDKATGEATGTFRESAAELIAKHIPETTAEEYSRGLLEAQASADQKLLDTYAEAEKSGKMTLRVLASQYVDPAKDTGQIPDLISRREKYRFGRLRADTAKIFIDGVIESGTAALLEPYLNRPGFTGLPTMGQETFNRLAIALDDAGFQIHIHAIGDRGIRMSLDALEAAQKANGVKDLRHHICHLELIDPADIPRFKTLGVFANFQALWAYPDPYITELTLPILGPERSRWLYPIGSVVQSGGIVAGGSDWSVSSMNPLEAIQVAITRRGLEETSEEPWIPEELVDLDTMLAAYTIKGAYLSHEEALRGSVEKGKLADLIVLDRDLFQIPKDKVHEAKVVLTMLDGKIIHKK
jgi:predicted amidohydrolase YtcJ